MKDKVLATTGRRCTDKGQVIGGGRQRGHSTDDTGRGQGDSREDADVTCTASIVSRNHELARNASIRTRHWMGSIHTRQGEHGAASDSTRTRINCQSRTRLTGTIDLITRSRAVYMHRQRKLLVEIQLGKSPD